MPPIAAHEPAEADHRADRLPREHVGREREQVGRPALVARRRQADQQHRHPRAVGLAREDHRGDDAGEQTSMAVLRAGFDRPAALDQRRRQPAAADAADVGDQVARSVSARIRRGPADAVFGCEEVGDPEQVEPPDRIGQELAERERPRSAGAEQRRPGSPWPSGAPRARSRMNCALGGRAAAGAASACSRAPTRRPATRSRARR